MGWGRGLLALGVALLAVAALDIALRAARVLPPDDPLLFFARTHSLRVDPFIETSPGRLAIRADWVNDGASLRGRRGLRAGRQFLLPGFRPIELARAKPPGMVRIVGLGDSTAYGLFVGADAAFISVLGKRITVSTGKPVEVVNLACAGFASDRVLALLPTALSLDPDLVVVYVGHNEMLGGSDGPAGGLTQALRARAWLLEGSALFAWLDHAWVATLRGAETDRVREEVAALEAGEIPTFVPEAVPESRRVAPSSEFRAQAAARYRDNLEAIVAAGRAAGVPLLLVLPVANLLWPPGISFHSPGFAGEREFAAALRAAAALRESGKREEELAALDRAVALSPEYAQAHSLRADALRALGRGDEARAEYATAIDRDGVTHRITSPLEAEFLAVARAEGVPWVDLRPLLQSDLSDDAAKRHFVDHVHPTAEGHAEIAAALREPALALLPSRAESARGADGR
ncbi:MAG TPA: GDSL-type esterase/lipase family protein [Myxococcota bacterium]|nr:GDSL-type esterase/lipase family protein [Myxococcota bacterium]